MTLASMLQLLPIVGSVVARTQDFATWWSEVTGALHPKDQATAKEALADIQADNDAGHARLQAKLAAAAKP